jgi:hypothetical protein
MRRLWRRQVDRLAGPYVSDLGAHLAAQDERLENVRVSVEALQRDVERSREELRALASWSERVVEGADRANAMLRHVYEEDPAQRRRLYALRESEEYELAFSEAEPLVSFVIPTHNRFESVRDVSLPSILAQTYSNIEVIVAGDCSPPETEQVIAAIGDPRVRFCNRTVRGPYPEDKSVRWYMLGTPPYNDGVALARGRWIATLGDDDAVRPEHTEALVRAAQENRYEHCYGRHLIHYPSGEELDVGGFPPAKGEFVLQSSIYHAGLAFFQMEPADYLSAEPNDWSLCRRMLAAGVRFGMVDAILADKYESRYEAHADWEVHGVPHVE